MKLAGRALSTVCTAYVIRRCALSDFQIEMVAITTSPLTYDSLKYKLMSKSIVLIHFICEFIKSFGFKEEMGPQASTKYQMDTG